MSMLAASASVMTEYPMDDKKDRDRWTRKVLTLPRIAHPSSRISDDAQHSLDIRGQSRTGQGNGELIRQESAFDGSLSRSHRRSVSSRTSLSSSYSSAQVRLPIFGQGKESEQSDRTIDEYERILREKVEHHANDVKRKFRQISDGDIPRAALQHLIASIFGTQHQISPQQIDQLIQRLHLKHLDKISFEQFSRSVLPDVRENASPEVPRSHRTATQMFFILKEKLRTKNADLFRLCAVCENPTAKLYKNQFQKILFELGYQMKPKEFDKLWDKFDSDGFHQIDGEKFLRCLTTESEEKRSIQRSETQDQQEAILHVQPPEPKSSSSITTPRLTTARIQLDENQIQTWLLHKFPHGFAHLERSLQRIDFDQSGWLPRERLVEQLKEYGFNLDGSLFTMFLSRLGIIPRPSDGYIPYRDLLFSLKERLSTQDVPPSSSEKDDDDNLQSSLAGQIEYLIAQNRDELGKEFHRLDSSHRGYLSTNQWKVFLEDLLEFPLRADEFEQVNKAFPRDPQGNLKWKDLLQQIDKRKPSLLQDNEQTSIIPQWDYMRSKNIRERLNYHAPKTSKPLEEQQKNDSPQRKNRSLDQLSELLKRLIRDRYKQIEDQFQIIDRSSYGELTPELLFQLFQRLSVSPSITRSEIDLLWSRCHLKENGNLDFYQFLREFGYTKSSAHYPNAKQNPPRRGDADFLLTSRKLYGDSVLVHGTALNAIRSNWNELKDEFLHFDPYQTGFIQTEEFDEILTDLCPAVNDEDLLNLREKFQNKNDSRMNYIRFLKHHVPIPQLLDQPAREHRHLSSELQQTIKRKLLGCERTFRRSLKQFDPENVGLVSAKDFQKVLNDYQCSFNDEQFYSLLSQLDPNMSGKINYHKFIQQFIKNN